MAQGFLMQQCILIFACTCFLRLLVPCLSDHSLKDLYSYLLLCINMMAIRFSSISCIYESLLFSIRCICLLLQLYLETFSIEQHFLIGNFTQLQTESMKGQVASGSHPLFRGDIFGKFPHSLSLEQTCDISEKGTLQWYQSIELAQL